MQERLRSPAQCAAATGQHTGAGQAFRRYNARLDRDKRD
jgi:hypothetical protein